MKILVDMNLSPKIAEMFAEKGIASEHRYRLGAHDAKDIEIVGYARQNGYIILTCDLDFTTLIAASKGQKPSIIQVRNQGTSLEELTERVASSVLQNAEELERGSILSIDVKKARVRLLHLPKSD